MFIGIFALVAILSGALAAVAGFGIGSILTPLLALETGTKIAVAAVSIPHFVATGLRFWLVRRHVDRRVLWSFGLTSAAGGLLGALLFTRFHNRALTFLLAALLVFAGIMGLLGLAQRLRFKGFAAWVAGALSGVFGGLVGNQGGIRSAAMLGLQVPRDAFIATSTAIGLMVDVARMPVYLFTAAAELLRHWPYIAAGTVGVVLGTLIGKPILAKISERIFQKVVSAAILLLGFWMLARAFLPE